MKFEIIMFRILLLTFLVSCSNYNVYEGILEGRVVSVSYGGVYYDSCEISIQTGENASIIRYVSSPSKVICKKYKKLIGKKVIINYRMERYKNFEYLSNLIIDE